MTSDDAVVDLKRLQELSDRLGGRLDAPALDPGRTKWGDARKAIAEATANADALCAELARVLPGLDKTDGANMRNGAAQLLGNLAAVVYAAGDEPGSLRLLAEAAKLAVRERYVRLFALAPRHLGVMLLIARADYLDRAGDGDAADELVQEARASMTDEEERAMLAAASW